MQRVMIFMTGQYRCFWETWWNVVRRILLPNRERFRLLLCIGLDSQVKHHQCPWAEDEKHRLAQILPIVWKSIGMIEDDLCLLWMDRRNPLFIEAGRSLEGYVLNHSLAPYWFDYLIYRSGSCIEYAQFSILYRWCLENDRTADLLLRIRTDVLFQHDMHLSSLDVRTATWGRAFSQLFPAHTAFFENHKEEVGREYSIHGDSDRWIITLRKNLIYVVPFDQARIIADMILHYGDWDSPHQNAYWFNAESQFRGCLRHHGFTVLEYSQTHDECYSDPDTERFPVYAIQRRR